MCQMTGSRPNRVSGIEARLTNDLPEGKVNYGQLQVTFEDGSVGWYEAGWGPMMSETAFFVKDVIGPLGSVSIVADSAASSGQSANIEAHTQTETLRLHYSGELNEQNQFVNQEKIIRLEDEPDHDELCLREQKFFLKSIEEDVDLADHWRDAINSMRIVAAAEESFRAGRTVDLV
jgi:predicted dehydrogenase